MGGAVCEVGSSEPACNGLAIQTPRRPVPLSYVPTPRQTHQAGKTTGRVAQADRARQATRNDSPAAPRVAPRDSRKVSVRESCVWPGLVTPWPGLFTPASHGAVRADHSNARGIANAERRRWARHRADIAEHAWWSSSCFCSIWTRFKSCCWDSQVSSIWLRWRANQPRVHEPSLGVS